MTGLARVIRGHMVKNYENVAPGTSVISLTQQLSVSSHHTTILIDYMLNRFGNKAELRQSSQKT